MLSKPVKSKIKRYIFYFIIAFLVVFVLRFFYALYFDRSSIFVNYAPGASQHYYYDAAPAPMNVSSVKNVASAKISQKDIYTGQSITIDQKYEKVANMTATSPDFDADNQKLRETIKNFDAVVQSEKLTGLKGSQTLTMAIGVMPDNFDALVEAVKEIGNLRGFTVDKIDKTDEFRRLMAQQETLLKSREAYEALKDKGGDIKDFVMLEEKILDIERNMQELGVNLGTYASENSFCTVNFSLSTEKPQAAAHISKRALFECFVASFIWTVIFYIIVAIIVTGFMLCALIIALIALKFARMLPKEDKTAVVPVSENNFENKA